MCGEDWRNAKRGGEKDEEEKEEREEENARKEPKICSTGVGFVENIVEIRISSHTPE